MSLEAKLTQQQRRKIVALAQKGTFPSKINIKGITQSQIHHVLEDARKSGELTIWFARPWSKTEDDSLLQSIQARIPTDKIKIEGRTPESIRGRIKTLRRKGTRIVCKPYWSMSQTRSLYAQLNAGKKPHEIKVEGKTLEAVRKRIDKLHKKKKLTKYFRKPGVHVIWSKDELLKLATAFEESCGGKDAAKQIHQSGVLPNRNKRAIKRKLIELGYFQVNQKLSSAAKRSIHPTQDELDRLRSFMEGEGRNWPTVLIAKKFGYKKDFVSKRRSKWGLKLNPKLASNDPVYKKWYGHVVKFRSLKAYAGRYVLPLKTVSALLAMFQTETLQRSPNKLVRCRSCGKQWYFTSDYFHVHFSPDDGGRELLDVCLACKIKKR